MFGFIHKKNNDSLIHEVQVLKQELEAIRQEKSTHSLTFIDQGRELQEWKCRAETAEKELLRLRHACKILSQHRMILVRELSRAFHVDPELIVGNPHTIVEILQNELEQLNVQKRQLDDEANRLAVARENLERKRNNMSGAYYRLKARAKKYQEVCESDPIDSIDNTESGLSG